MKTFKKVITVMALALIALGPVAIYAQKKSIDLEYSVLVEASLENCYDTLKNLKEFPNWSPFLVSDPEQNYKITGETGELGSAYHWVGVKEKGKGKQILNELVENKLVRMDCDIEKPFKGKPVFAYYLERSEGKTKITQKFKLPVSGFNKFMIKLFGGVKDISKTNELGMQRLKEYLEYGESVNLATK